MAIAPQDASNTTDSTTAKAAGAGAGWLPLIERAGDDSLGNALIRMAKMAAGAHRAQLGDQQNVGLAIQHDADRARRVVTRLLRKEVDR